MPCDTRSGTELACGGSEAPSSDHDFAALLAAAVAPADSNRLGQADVAELLPGEVVDGRFRVERLAGRGGMGTVYRCRDGWTAEPVALKVLRTSAAADCARFRREARALAVLVHPAIVRFISCGMRASGSAYLAMEWLDGEDLGARLRRGALSPRECLELGTRVCSALSSAHIDGFVHRDLKPSNVFLPNGLVSEARLLDFGLARGLVATQTVTGAGTVLGTVGYMAPEQASALATDGRADLFSLGCVLYEALTGSPAFRGRGRAEVLASVLRGAVPSVRALRPEAPIELAELIAALLQKERADRPRDAATVLRALSSMAPLDLCTSSAPDDRARAQSLAARPAPLAQASNEPPFCGRARELVLLESTLAECVAEGVARTVILSGPPGMGKSRLAREFLARVSRHLRVRVVSAFASSASGELGPVPLDAPENGSRAVGWSVLDGSAAFDPCQDASCVDQPVILLIDDAQWADSVRLLALEQAVRRRHDRPLLFLAIARDDMAAGLRKTCARLEPQEIALRGLPPRATERLARSIAGDLLADEVLAAALAQARGHPGKLQQLLAARALGGR